MTPEEIRSVATKRIQQAIAPLPGGDVASNQAIAQALVLSAVTIGFATVDIPPDFKRIKVITNEALAVIDTGIIQTMEGN